MLSLQILAVGAGLWALSWSAGKLIEGSAVLARQLQISMFTIGVVIIGFGTSLPELLASAVAAARGSGNIAIGNAFGSNLANLALILGISALIRSLHAPTSLLTRNLPLLLLATAGAFVALADNHLDRLEGALLALALVLIIAGIVRQGADPDLVVDAQVKDEPLTVAGMQVAGGLALLLVSAWVLIWGASGLARTFGISELVIGLVLVAIGTSLPELAAALASIRRTQSAGPLILGNVVGSNLFNTLGVVGLPAMLRPFDTDPALWPSALLMLGLTVLLGGLLLAPPRFSLTRGAGAFLVVCYMGYLTWIVAGSLSA